MTEQPPPPSAASTMFAVNNITTYRHPVHPLNGTRTGVVPHPSQEGDAYAHEFPDQVISIWQNGGDLRSPVLDQRRQQRKFPHISTCNNWIQQLGVEGHTCCKRLTGNRIFQKEVHGHDLVNLALYRMVRPKGYIDEVRAYVHNQNPANAPYSQSQVIRAERRLGLICKAASTTSDCAYFQLNLFKHQQYWHTAYPGGTLGKSTRDVIDLDESNYKFERQNRKFGKVTREKRCDARGKYNRGEGSVSLLMAISGDERATQTFSFHRCYTEGGTDLWQFFNFTLELCDWLDAHRLGRSFTMDNLNIHKHPVILNLIHEHNRRMIFRAPYWSCDGAIKNIFNRPLGRDS